MLRGALGRPPVIVVNAGLVRNLLSVVSTRKGGDNPKHTDM